MRPGPALDERFTIISREFMGTRRWCAFDKATGWTGPMHDLGDYEAALKDRPPEVERTTTQ